MLTSWNLEPNIWSERRTGTKLDLNLRFGSAVQSSNPGSGPNFGITTCKCPVWKIIHSDNSKYHSKMISQQLKEDAAAEAGADGESDSKDDSDGNNPDEPNPLEPPAYTTS